jgi:hypothetical protein
MFFAYLYREYRTKEFHRHVYELKEQADFLSKTGRARLAFEKYDEVLAEIGDQSQSDAKLHGYAEVSRKLRDRLYAAVKNEVEREAVARQIPKRNPKIPVEVSYPMIQEVFSPRRKVIGMTRKRTVEVRLNMRVSEDVLREIALEFKSNETDQFDYTHILF